MSSSLFEVKYASERKMNKYGIYDLDQFEYKEPIRYQKPTSIYDTYSRENFEDSLLQIILKNNREYEANMLVEEESYEGNSITINEFVKREPKSIDEFLEWVKSRLHVKNVDYLSSKEQEDLIEICFQEVKFQWKEIRRNIEDSTLSKDELVELRRRLYVNVISICEKLFNYYVKRADTLKSREVFSDEANFVRIKTLLACDLKRFLNIHPLKHHLVFDLKRSQQKRDSEQMSPSSLKPKPKEFLNLKRISVKDLIEDFRLKYKIRGRRYKTIKDHLKDIYDNMPVLETKKIEKMLKKLPQPVEVEDKEDDEEIFHDREELSKSSPIDGQKEVKPIEDELALLSRLSDSSLKNAKIIFKSRSMINLDESSLAEELSLNIVKIVQDRYKTTDLIVHKSSFKSLPKPEIEPFKDRRVDFDQISRESDKTIAIRIKQDLENLTMEVKHRKETLENDDQPLLMNLTTKPDQKSRMKEIKSKMKEISKRRKKFLEEIQLPLIKKRTHVQPSTLEIKFFNKFTIRLSDIRVSTRVLRFNVTCELYPPLYNDLVSEIDSEMIQHLDRNLFIGGEVKEIYDELLKTVEENHLKFDLDTYVQKAPSKLSYDSSFTSSMLKAYGRTKSTNQRLAQSSLKKPPWDGENFKEWNKTYLNNFFSQDNNTLKKPLYEQIKLEKSRIKSSKLNELRTELKPEKVELFERSDPTKFDNKELKHWYNWWQNNFTSEDYFKYMSTQNSDYLGLLHHLYDDRSNGMVELNEHELRLEEERKRAEKERAEILEELRKKKFSYEQGVWNTNSVLLGGLGNDPVIDEDDDPVSRMRKNLENSRPKSKKVQLFRDPDKDDSDEEEKAKSKMIESLKEKKKEAPNARLERVWNMLRMSDSEKIDMAIKYCQIEFANRLSKALEYWESAADLIVRREKIIFDLENFERFASDPNRYFLKGSKGSSAARLEEAIQREQFYKKIDEVQQQLETILIEIEQQYNDCICYNGRVYLEKMKWDRIEMLHYLTEERRVKYFKHEIRTKHLQAKNSLVKI